MENPCTNCIVKVNCTAICEDKKNFKQILSNAMLCYRSGGYANDKQTRMLHQRYMALALEHREDETRIQLRKARICMDDN